MAKESGSTVKVGSTTFNFSVASMIYTDEGILRFLNSESYKRVATRILYSKGQAKFKLMKSFRSVSYEDQRQRDCTFNQLRAIGWNNEEAKEILKLWVG